MSAHSNSVILIALEPVWNGTKVSHKCARYKMSIWSLITAGAKKIAVIPTAANRILLFMF